MGIVRKVTTNLSPILLIGTHRSGTTMLSQILERYGVFMGRKKEQNNEARFFLDINQEILNACGGSWDNPAVAKWLISSPKLREFYVKSIVGRLSSYHAASYWGWSRFFSSKNEMLFGWKDPRVSALLPLWNEIFPNARYVRIVRNGIDVASSLRFREQRFLIGIKTKKQNHGLVRTLDRKVNSPRCLSLEGAFSLWEEYVDFEDLWIDKLKLNVLTFRYEDFLNTPREILESILHHLGLTSRSSINVDEVISDINADRKFAFKSNSELVEFYESVREESSVLRRYNYHEL